MHHSGLQGQGEGRAPGAQGAGSPGGGGAAAGLETEATTDWDTEPDAEREHAGFPPSLLSLTVVPLAKSAALRVWGVQPERVTPKGELSRGQGRKL